MNNSATAGLCVASAVIAITVVVVSLAADPLEQDPRLVGFALALCIVFHGGMAFVLRGVGPLILAPPAARRRVA